MRDRPTGEITVRGRSVTFDEYGDPEGKPVVFFHGTPGSRLLAGLFKDAARRAGLRLLAPDRPGYGQSAPWSERSLTDAGDIVGGLLDVCETDDARIVAFSGGGPHALAAAVTHPKRVCEVHAISGATPHTVGEPAATQRRLAMLARRTPRLLRCLFRAQAWFADRSPALVVSQFTTDPTNVSDADTQLVARDFVEAVGKGASGAVAESQLLAEPWGFDLTKIDVPIQLWHGEHDMNVPVGGVRELCASLPDPELTVRDTDHLTTLLEYRDALA